MSSISSVQNNSYNYSDYGRYASGKKVNTAADGAAELAIINKEDAQARGYAVGSNNIGAAQDMIGIADGALSGIADSLQRMRELALQASNSALMTDSDRAAIQNEIDGLKQGIADTASRASYNTKNLLDGSNGTFQIATDSNGNGTSVTTTDVTLSSLGIAGFDVTGSFDIADIDKALETVNKGRSEMGAQSNGLSYVADYNALARHNTVAAQSRLEDLDYPKAISDTKKKQTLQEYALAMQRKFMENERSSSARLFQ